jgi:hypothetical protein
MAFAGLRGTGSMGTDERPKNFREMILWRNPNGTAPLTALLSKVAKEGVNDPEFSWWDEVVGLTRLQVNGEVASNVSTIVVDSTDPSVANPSTNYGTALNLVPGDLLMVEPATDQEAMTEIVKVLSVESATTFTVQRGAADTTAATIANDRWLLKIGSAFAEGTGAPPSASRNPVKFSNLTQIFKTTYSLTNTVIPTKMRTGDPLSNDKKRKMWDHASAMEQAFLWGQKYETVGANGQPERYMAGLRSFIPTSNSTIFSADIDPIGLLDAISPCFNYETPAGDQRLVFAGNGALNALNKMAYSQASTSFQYDGIINVYGMDLKSYVIPQGRIAVKTHPMLSLHPLYTYSMWGIDFASLKYRYLNGRDTTFKDNIQGNDEDLRRGEWKTECSLEVHRGGTTMFYLGNVKYVGD